MQGNQKQAFDLGMFVGNLALDENGRSDYVSLEGLQEELEECKNDEKLSDILAKGTKLWEHTKGAENNVRQVQLDAIQAAESKLTKFVEDIIVPPGMVDIIVDGEVNEEYLKTLESLSKKLKFAEVDSMVTTSKALKVVQPELERLRQKAVSKVFEFIAQKIHALRKLKTSIQIPQDNILLKYRCLIIFLKEHGMEIYNEVKATYIDTMNKILSAHFRAYIQAMGKLQLDIATSSDLIGVETKSTRLSLGRRESLRNGSAVFALGDRINILKEIDQPALILHTAEVNSERYPYEVLFRSLHKLLMDTAASEYLFCGDFFGEESIFYEIFAGPFAVLDEHFNVVLPNCYDALGLMLMIRIVDQHQMVMFKRKIPCLDSYLDKVNISLWSRLKLVLDMHLNSLRNANVRTLWEDDVHPHYVMWRYAEFVASLVHLNVEYGDGQLDLNFERLQMAIDDLLNKLAKTFTKPKLQTTFLINNYDVMVTVLMKSGTGGGSTMVHFWHLLKSNIPIFVEEMLLEHFNDLIKFVTSRGSEESSSSAENPSATDLEPLAWDFLSRWKAAIELMYEDCITSFSDSLCGRMILNMAYLRLGFYYRRLKVCARRIEGSFNGSFNRVLFPVTYISDEVDKYLKAF
ncbi:vacuolar protein sorting-associated protein 52 A isoform X2 [Dioscorea cayenensis subsp. rotundata]|nr:vacuolar protein sorting-associated protein 52 A isoform X2 [Dioscorea cayenensis subsp. rotundata]